MSGSRGKKTNGAPNIRNPNRVWILGKRRIGERPGWGFFLEGKNH
jgi:hypothetical protein